MIDPTGQGKKLNTLIQHAVVVSAFSAGRIAQGSTVKAEVVNSRQGGFGADNLRLHLPYLLARHADETMTNISLRTQITQIRWQMSSQTGNSTSPSAYCGCVTGTISAKSSEWLASENPLVHEKRKKTLSCVDWNL